MQIVLDTNALIRLFTDDIPAKAERVEKLLEEEKEIFVPDVVFPELEYILMKKYGLPRSKVIDACLFLLSQENVKKSTHIKKAIEIYRRTKLDMADCIIAASSLKGSLASFDKDLLKVKEVNPFWK